jgi:hypothetical protein
MKSQHIAPAAINALKEALTAVYWYKNDLRTFLLHTIDDPNLLARLNWTEYKRNIVYTLVEYLARNQNAHRDTLVKLMTEVGRIEDFSHLLRVEDGEAKAKQAREAVTALRTFIKPHEDLMKEQEAAQERREESLRKTALMQGLRESLGALRQEYFQLLGNDEPQKRGFRLEKILKKLFELFDLDPKASFRIVGEQIDGAFTFDKTDYLFEAKWQKEPVSADDLDTFSRKVERKLENTLGLFLSINGFSTDGITAHSRGRLVVILVDGADLMAVLDDRIDLVQLLHRKRRHAAQTGNIYLKVNEILVSG